MSNKPGRAAPRNWVAKHAGQQNRGGAHGKTRKAERQDRRIQLKREIRRNDESPFFMSVAFLAAHEAGSSVLPAPGKASAS